MKEKKKKSRKGKKNEPINESRRPKNCKRIKKRRTKSQMDFNF